MNKYRVTRAGILLQHQSDVGRPKADLEVIEVDADKYEVGIFDITFDKTNRVSKGIGQFKLEELVDGNWETIKL